ncbi:hypothetical protein [Lysobacter panacisoli]|uniref:Uncharacterized protein n=1 Tax=Lysobacter panacisoli TaxID=1255263 RepID=A0ABP9LSC2_9GAMM|nr:hypothetical protein [Lysobacter panacisoli]
MSPIEHVSDIHDAESLALLLGALPGALVKLLGDQVISATYGYGCNLHPDLWYVPMKVGTGWLDRFVRESQEQRIFEPCRSDMCFEVPDGRLAVEFCHEGHVHLRGTDTRLREDFLRLTPFDGLSLSAIEPEKESVSFPPAEK